MKQILECDCSKASQTVYVIVSSITICTARGCPNVSFGDWSIAQYKGGANRGTRRSMTASVGAGEREGVLEVYYSDSRVYLEHFRNLDLYTVHFKAITTRS